MPLNNTEPRIAGVSIEVKEVSKQYTTLKGGTVDALEDVSISVKAGEFVSVVGPSGCGKSTLMMLVAGLIKTTGGNIRINDRLVNGPVSEAGIVFQRDVLLDWRSVFSNVMLPVEIKGLDRAEHTVMARELLRSVGLEGFEDKFPGELSGGMRQRVALCRALVQKPGLLLMDEPFGALDALTREQMNLDLQKMWQRDQNTVLFITHSIEEAIFLADRVVVMSARPGTIVEIIDIGLSRPRGPHIRTKSTFVGHQEYIRSLFMEQGVLSKA